MNGLVIVLIGIVVLFAGYLFYGRWLAKKWGLDPKAETPAVKYEDGEDYVPSSKFTVFAHQFSSIAGAGPVTGPILASVFGWVPVLLWLLIGGLFFGAVQDFGALYASVKNEGKSMGMIIEKYIGKAGRKLFMLFCWLFTLLVIAAFTDMVAGTFVGKGVVDMAKETSYANASAASISMLFIVAAIVFGVIQKHVKNMNEGVRAVIAIALLVGMFALGMHLPWYATKTAWIYIVMAYLFLASVMPMWLLMQPRDYMTTFMLLGMIIGAVVGVVVAHPTMQLNAYNGFNVGGIICSQHCLSRLPVVPFPDSTVWYLPVHHQRRSGREGYADGWLWCHDCRVIAWYHRIGCCRCCCSQWYKPDGTPFAIFSSGVAGFLEKLGLPVQLATVFMTMCVSALALTSLDSVARIGRMSFQELFLGDTTDTSKMPVWQKILTNKYFATVVTLFFGYLLTLGGYTNVWPLFGSANQLLAALVLIALAVFLKTTGRTGWTLYAPMFIMLAVTFTALVQKTIALVKNIAGGNATMLVDGLQFIVAILLMVLGVLVAFSCLKKLFTKKAEAEN